MHFPTENTTQRHHKRISTQIDTELNVCIGVTTVNFSRNFISFSYFVVVLSVLVVLNIPMKSFSLFMVLLSFFHMIHLLQYKPRMYVNIANEKSVVDNTLQYLCFAERQIFGTMATNRSHD